MRLKCLGRIALDLQNLISEVLPIAISSAAMVEEKSGLSSDRVLEPREQLAVVDRLAALFASFRFKHDLPHF
jgi:hypothetical protein